MRSSRTANNNRRDKFCGVVLYMKHRNPVSVQRQLQPVHAYCYYLLLYVGCCFTLCRCKWSLCATFFHTSTYLQLPISFFCLFLRIVFVTLCCCGCTKISNTKQQKLTPFNRALYLTSSIINRFSNLIALRWPLPWSCCKTLLLQRSVQQYEHVCECALYTVMCWC